MCSGSAKKCRTAHGSLIARGSVRCFPSCAIRLGCPAGSSNKKPDWRGCAPAGSISCPLGGEQGHCCGTGSGATRSAQFAQAILPLGRFWEIAYNYMCAVAHGILTLRGYGWFCLTCGGNLTSGVFFTRSGRIARCYHGNSQSQHQALYRHFARASGFACELRMVVRGSTPLVSIQNHCK